MNNVKKMTLQRKRNRCLQFAKRTSDTKKHTERLLAADRQRRLDY